MGHVKGIGGIFFKAKDPKMMKAWYQEHLGIEPNADGGVMIQWRAHDDPSKEHLTVWEPFPQDTTYFDPTNVPYMINYIVDDLDAVLSELRAKGIEVDDKVEDYEFGRFGWARDPEGNRFELWQPPKK
jgi:predicted enzyme related to lactoylglutathione lyase